MPPTDEIWPALPFAAWQDTYATLHRWTQIVGKVRLVQSPWLNHSWSVTLYVTRSGLSTGPMPHGRRTFEIEFDFRQQALRISPSDGEPRSFALEAQPVAAFYARLMAELDAMGLPVRIVKKPNELPDATPFDEDDGPRVYDPEAAFRFWRVLVQVDRVFTAFRARFVGKCSPVHYFWGAADLAVTRFSGRPAPVHKGGVPNLPDAVAREAYSHEVSSAGFWPGGGPVPDPVFYSYAYPEPPGFRDAAVRPAEAYYHADLGEFLLPYDAVRLAADPDAALLAFLESTYEAAATLGGWDRAALEAATDPRASRG